MKTNTLIYTIALMLFLFSSCRKEIDITEEIINPPVPTIKVESSVIGLVQDENSLPIEDAIVRLKDETVYTDENGIFQFKNVIMNENGTFITVEKNQYFKGSRMFYPELGNVNNVSIQLMEKVNVGNFQSDNGGLIKFEDVELSFPPNGIVTESGNDYTGNVIVEAKYLDPSLRETHDQMPGDLTALSTENELVALSSYAMITVELTSETGEALQLKESFPCNAKIPVSSSLQNSAPNEIELWSFDETVGRWIEEGIATYNNGYYEAEIPHFSFWNCDVPGNYADIDITIYNFESPFSNVVVRITDTESGTSNFDITDNNGKVSGKVPANVNLLLEVIDNCDQPIYSENLGSLSGMYSFSINVNYQNYSSFSGSVSSCASSISDLTYVRIEADDIYSYFMLDTNDEFSGTVNYCEASSVIKAKAMDPVNGLTSTTTVEAVADIIDFGDLEMCDTLILDIYTYQFGDSTLYIDQLNTNTDYSYVYAANSIEDTNGDLIKVFLEVTVLNWLTGDTHTRIFIHDVNNPGDEHTFSFPNSGFDVTGTLDSYMISEGEDDYLIFTGEFTDFTITDSTLWDDSYSPFYFYTSAQID